MKREAMLVVIRGLAGGAAVGTFGGMAGAGYWGY